MTEPPRRDIDPCWFHRFGGGEPCKMPGKWQWRDPPDTPARAVLLAMRWCDEHRHPTDSHVTQEISQ